MTITRFQRLGRSDVYAVSVDGSYVGDIKYEAACWWVRLPGASWQKNGHTTAAGGVRALVEGQ